MYEAVHPHPDGDSTVARFARTAARFGYDGIVSRTRLDADLATVGETYGIDVVDGVEVVADDPSGASGAVGNFRPKQTLVIVRGGDERLNRFAVEQERVDVLAQPMAGDGDFDHVLARAAHDNGVRVEFDLGPILRSSGGPRIRALQGMRKLRTLVEQYDVPYVVSARPRSHLQVRAPRELRALGETVGFSAPQVETGLREWGRLVARNRARRSEDYVAPGVWRGRPDDTESSGPTGAQSVSGEGDEE